MMPPGYQAPGDARAELGRLNEIEIIYGVISDDLDMLLYGVNLIIERYVTCISSNNTRG